MVTILHICKKNAKLSEFLHTLLAILATCHLTSLSKWAWFIPVCRAECFQWSMACLASTNCGLLSLALYRIGEHLLSGGISAVAAVLAGYNLGTVAHRPTTNWGRQLPGSLRAKIPIYQSEPGQGTFPYAKKFLSLGAKSTVFMSKSMSIFLSFKFCV